jgi:hypothetical protein
MLLILSILFMSINLGFYDKVNLRNFSQIENVNEIKPELSDISVAYEWYKTWGGNGTDMGWDIAVDSNDFIYVVGNTFSIGSESSNIMLVKYNNLGEQIWNHTLITNCTDVGYGIAVDNLDNIYISGVTNYSSKYGDVFIAKFNSFGTQIWNKTWGTNNFDCGYSIALDQDGNIYVTGTAGATDYNEGGDLLLLKYNNSGEFQWARKTDHFDSMDCGYGITINSSNEIYITGEIHKWYEFIMQLDDFLLVAKFNSSGEQLWNTTWGQPSFTYSRGNSLLTFGNFLYIVGTTSAYDANNQDLCILKYTKAGSLEWVKYWGEDNWEIGYDIILSSFGDLYVVGLSGSPFIEQDTMFIIKYDYQGNQIFNASWDGEASNIALGITMDNKSNIYCTGERKSTTNDDYDMLIVKFSNDTDSDGLSDWLEINRYFTDPNDEDDDNDELLDGEEVFEYFTEPKDPDTDNDLLLDGREVNYYLTNPLRRDTDNDGFSDYDEVIIFHTDPNNPFSNPYSVIVLPISASLITLFLGIYFVRKKIKRKTVE